LRQRCSLQAAVQVRAHGRAAPAVVPKVILAGCRCLLTCAIGLGLRCA
jgi:hypothetical protein